LKSHRYLAQGVNAHMRARPWPLCHGVPALSPARRATP
jgi:hypothetical protein